MRFFALYAQKVEVLELSLPKFKIVSTHDKGLEDAIKTSGMTEILCESGKPNGGKPNFSGISSEFSICVSKVIKKLFINIPLLPNMGLPLPGDSKDDD